MNEEILYPENCLECNEPLSLNCIIDGCGLCTTCYLKLHDQYGEDLENCVRDL